MLSPYRVYPNNTNKRTKKVKKNIFDNNSHRDNELERPPMTSNDLKMTSNQPVKKKQIKGVANIEINEHYLDEILHNTDT